MARNDLNDPFLNVYPQSGQPNTVSDPLLNVQNDGMNTPASMPSIFDAPYTQPSAPQASGYINPGDKYLVGNAPTYPNQPPVPLSQAMANIPQAPTLKEQTQGILNEMGTTGAAPQTTQPMTTFDGGGTASTTGQGRQMTPEEINAQEQIKKRLELEAAGLPTKKEQQQAQTVAEAKARIGVKAALKSIEQETGMSAADVGKKIGWEQGDGMSAKEALRKVNAFQKSRTMAKANDKRAAKEIDQITQKAEWVDDVPQNDAARFEAIDNALDSVGSDPLSEDPLRESMTDSQSREYERLRSKVAGDRARDNDFKRMDKFVNDIQRKDRQKFARKQARADKKEAEAAYAKAQSKEDQQWVDNITKELDEVNKLITRYENSYPSAQKKIMTDEQYKDRLANAERLRKLRSDFNKTGSRGEPAAQQQSTNPDDYDVGESVEVNGVNYTKLENGKWQKS